jgi:hypothetical protein
MTDFSDFLTMTIEHSPFSEPDSHSISQEIPHHSSDPDVRLSVHMNPPLHIILGQLNQIHTLTASFPKRERERKKRNCVIHYAPSRDVWGSEGITPLFVTLH